MTTNRKRLVYGGQKGLDSHVARLENSGWKVVKSEIITFQRGRRKGTAYIAELEKE